MKICEAAAKALDILGKPCRAEEILKLICDKKMYDFNIEDSMYTLIDGILKSCENVRMPKEQKQKLFIRVHPNIFSLLEWERKLI